MKGKPCRVGTIGLGGIARAVHLPGVGRSPDLTLAAICDIDAEKRAYFKELCHIDDAHCFADYNELIRCPDVDVVDICTPNDMHFEMARAAIMAGKPYSLEKPVTLNAAEANELARLTRERHLPNMVCFSYRFKAASRFARELVRGGSIGEVYHVNMQYFMGGALPYRDMPLRWRNIRARAGSGALGDLGSHALDLVRFITGQEYSGVVGHLGTYVKERRLPDGDGKGVVDTDDFANFSAQMNGGVSASFQITKMAYARSNYQRMEIYGGKGAVIYYLNRRQDDLAADADEIEVCVGSPYDDTRSYTMLPIPARFKTDQMQNFADIVNGCGDELAATIFDGQINMRVIEAVLESTQTRAWVDL